MPGMTKHYLSLAVVLFLAVAFGVYAYSQLASHSLTNAGFSATSASLPEPAPLSQAIYTSGPPMPGDPHCSWAESAS